jgi:hypothetical protein
MTIFSLNLVSITCFEHQNNDRKLKQTRTTEHQNTDRKLKKTNTPTIFHDLGELVNKIPLEELANKIPK